MNKNKTWQTKKLGEVCSIQTGKYDANHSTTNGKYRFYTCAFDYLYCDTNRFKGESIILPGNGANVGEVFYYNGEFDAYQRTYVLNEIKTNAKYLFYHLYGNWKIRNKDKQYGSATNYIRMANFTDYEIPVPPLETQHAIVSKIEELFSELDQGIADLKTAQAQLKVYRQSVLKYAFEGNKFKKNNLRKLKDITSKIGSGSTPKGGSDSYFDSGIPLVRSLNIHFECIKYKGLAFIDNKQAEKLKNVIINENDVLLNITGASIGRVNIAPKEFHNGRVNQHVSIIRPKNNSFLPKYLKYFIQTSEIQNWISNANYGVTRQALTKSMLENLEVPLPPIEEQHLIVQEIENRLSVADKMEESIQESLQKAEALRQSILKKAFSGQLL